MPPETDPQLDLSWQFALERAPVREVPQSPELALAQIVDGLEVDARTAREVAENGYSAGAAVAELARELVIEVAQPERLSALCALWQCDSTTALAQVLTDWPNLISGARGPQAQELLQDVYNHVYQLAEANLNKQLGEMLTYDAAELVDTELTAFTQSYGLGQIHFHNELDTVPWLAKMRAAAARRLTMPAAAPREYVEHDNIALLQHLSSEGDLDPESLVIEISPPIHQFQYKLMLRCHHFQDGRWVSDQFSLPALQDHTAFHAKVQAELSGWYLTRDRVNQADARDRVLADAIVTPPLAAGEAINRLLEIYNQYAQLAVPVTTELIVQNDARVAAAFAPAKTQLTDFTSLLLAHAGEMALDPHSRLFWHQRYDEVLMGCLAHFMPTDQLLDQEFSAEDIAYIRDLDTVRAAVTGDLGDRIAATSRGQLRVRADSDCAHIDAIIGQQRGQTQVTQPLGPVTTRNAEGVALEWRTILKNGIPTRILRCPVCGHPELDPCWDSCPGCQNKTEELRLRYEGNSLKELQQQYRIKQQQLAQDRLAAHSTPETDASDGLWSRLFSSLTMPFQRVLEVLEVEG